MRGRAITTCSRKKTRWLCGLAAVFLGLFAWAPGTEAQPVPRVVILGPTPVDDRLADAFKQGLSEFGFVEGRTVAVEARDAGGKPAALNEMARELVRLNVDLIFARGAAALSASYQATRQIPIVAMDLESDPVAKGFVRTLGQPGGNVTGIFLDLPELSAKQLQLLKEVVPRVSRVAILGDPAYNAPQFPSTEAAARKLAIQPQLLKVEAEGDAAGAIEAAVKGRAHAVLFLSSPMVFYQRAELATLALKRHLPAVSMFTEFADSGGFMTYGPNMREAFRRIGAYAARILKGAKPSGLPVERPAKFEWVVNLKTASALGLRVPKRALARADRVIE